MLHGGPEALRVVAMATSFWTKIAIIGFVRMTATKQLVMEGVTVGVVSRQNADVADNLHLGTSPWQPFFGFQWATTSVV